MLKAEKKKSKGVQKGRNAEVKVTIWKINLHTLHTNYNISNKSSPFRKKVDYKEIEDKEAASGSKAEKLAKFLLEKEESEREKDENKGQKKYTLTDLARKRNKKKKEATEEVEKKN